MVRPLDDLTRQALLGYLADRRRRWLLTANRHLLLTRSTAGDTTPVSEYYLGQHLRSRIPGGVRLDAIRADRILEEALHHGPDAHKLVTLFGLDTSTAILYTDVASRIRASLEPALHSGSCDETQ